MARTVDVGCMLDFDCSPKQTTYNKRSRNGPHCLRNATSFHLFVQSCAQGSGERAIPTVSDCTRPVVCIQRRIYKMWGRAGDLALLPFSFTLRYLAMPFCGCSDGQWWKITGKIAFQNLESPTSWGPIRPKSLDAPKSGLCVYDFYRAITFTA